MRITPKCASTPDAHHPRMRITKLALPLTQFGQLGPLFFGCQKWRIAHMTEKVQMMVETIIMMVMMVILMKWMTKMTKKLTNIMTLSQYLIIFGPFTL